MNRYIILAILLAMACHARPMIKRADYSLDRDRLEIPCSNYGNIFETPDMIPPLSGQHVVFTMRNGIAVYSMLFNGKPLLVRKNGRNQPVIIYEGNLVPALNSEPFKASYPDMSFVNRILKAEQRIGLDTIDTDVKYTPIPGNHSPQKYDRNGRPIFVPSSPTRYNQATTLKIKPGSKYTEYTSDYRFIPAEKIVYRLGNGQLLFLYPLASARDEYLLQNPAFMKMPFKGETLILLDRNCNGDFFDSEDAATDRSVGFFHMSHTNRDAVLRAFPGWFRTVRYLETQGLTIQKDSLPGKLVLINKHFSPRKTNGTVPLRFANLSTTADTTITINGKVHKSGVFSEGKYETTIEPGKYEFLIEASTHLPYSVQLSIDPGKVIQITIPGGPECGTVQLETKHDIFILIITPVGSRTQTMLHDSKSFPLFPGEYTIILNTGFTRLQQRVTVRSRQTTPLVLTEPVPLFKPAPKPVPRADSRNDGGAASSD